ncbi:Hypothetical predicted protein, partial [Pelobates cultripes]
MASEILAHLLPMPLELTPEVCLLYIWPENLTKVHTKLLFHTLIAACTLIARTWKSQDIPMKYMLVQQIQTNWEYELMADQQIGKRRTTAEAGQLWKNILEHHGKP